MRLLLISLAFFHFACSSEQKSKNIETKSVTDTSTTILLDIDKSDTTVIFHDENKYYSHTIYIEREKNVEIFKRLCDFSFNHFDSGSYIDLYRHVTENHFASTYSKNNHDLPKYWLPLYQWKGEFYIYAPCDWGTTGRLMINDSAYVVWYMDGPQPFPYLYREKSDLNKHSLSLVDVFSLELNEKDLEISIFDESTGAAVFIETYGRTSKRLYVPVSSAHQYNMIVNYCDGEKQSEFIFEEVDFDSLLNIP